MLCKAASKKLCPAGSCRPAQSKPNTAILRVRCLRTNATAPVTSLTAVASHTHAQSRKQLSRQPITASRTAVSCSRCNASAPGTGSDLSQAGRAAKGRADSAACTAATCSRLRSPTWSGNDSTRVQLGLSTVRWGARNLGGAQHRADYACEGALKAVQHCVMCQGRGQLGCGARCHMPPPLEGGRRKELQHRGDAQSLRVTSSDQSHESKWQHIWVHAYLVRGHQAPKSSAKLAQLEGPKALVTLRQSHRARISGHTCQTDWGVP
jgi:hypothetical protein